MAATIAFDADHTITVTEYAEGTPCTFEDIYDADVAGGWGIVTKPATKTYVIAGNLVVGDGTDPCYLTDTDANITFTYAWAASENAFWWRTGSVTQMGILSNGYGRDGCHLVFRALAANEFWFGTGSPERGTFLFYGGYLKSAGSHGGRFYCRNGTLDFTDSVLDGYSRSILYFAPTYNRTTLNGTSNYLYSSVMDAINITCLNNSYDIYVSNNNNYQRYENLVCLPSPGTIRLANRDGNVVCLINPDATNYNTTFGGASDPACYVIYRFTLDLKVIDVDGNPIENALVSIKDSDGVSIGCKDPAVTTSELIVRNETGIDVSDGSEFAADDIIRIAEEFMTVVSVAGNTLTVTRDTYEGYPQPYQIPSGYDVFIVSGSAPTDASGDILTQMTTYKWEKELNGTESSKTYGDYTVTVSKAGYASKTVKYTMDRKREDVVLLSPEGSTQIYDSTIYDSTIY